MFCWHLNFRMRCLCAQIKQGVTLTGRNRTGPLWSVGRLTARVPDAPTAHAPGGRPARPPAASQTTNDRRRQTTTTTDTSDRY